MTTDFDPPKEPQLRHNIRTMKNTIDKLVGGRTGAEKEAYFKKRGPKFRNMILDSESMIKKYELSRKSENMPKVDAADMIKAMNSVAEYQQGKEKKFFSTPKQERFDWSVTLGLAMTDGTKANRYAMQKIDDIAYQRGIITVDEKGRHPEAEREVMSLRNAYNVRLNEVKPKTTASEREKMADLKADALGLN